MRSGTGAGPFIRDTVVHLNSISTSPYCRKVLIAAAELGLNDRIEVREGYGKENPLGKVPALVISDERIIVDSRVICAFLQTLNPKRLLVPDDCTGKFDALTIEALADGIMDACLIRMNGGGPRSREHPLQRHKVECALDYFEKIWPRHEAELQIGQIAAIAALSYLDLRFAEENWRSSRPRLAAWYAVCLKRETIRTYVR
ncbi:glutathione S-transferase family protein [Bradyrhizobium ottawaense]|uniref:glutathione S-transferase family protein n=1 Tax=Bradyrhizobium ottawaense TaxID=931866 RepID=UPI00384DC9EF